MDTTLAGFDFAALRRGLERSEAETLIGLYAEGAEMTIVDRNRPPSAPMRLLGREAIAAFWRDVCARDMTHAVRHEVLGERRVALVESCAYPDGCHVMSAMTLDLDGAGRLGLDATLPGLARHPLRGQGAGGRTAADLPGICPAAARARTVGLTRPAFPSPVRALSPYARGIAMPGVHLVTATLGLHPEIRSPVAMGEGPSPAGARCGAFEDSSK